MRARTCGRVRREPHGRDLGQGTQGPGAVAAHHDQRRGQARRWQGAVHLHAQRPRRYRGRPAGLPGRCRDLPARGQCRQHRQGLGPYLQGGRGVRHGGRARQGALQRVGRDLPARRAGTPGDEDRAEDVRRTGGGHGVLYVPQAARCGRGRHPFDHRLHGGGRLRDLRGQRGRCQAVESPLGGRRGVRFAEHRPRSARHAAS